jgi:hypothetical protein
MTATTLRFPSKSFSLKLKEILGVPTYVDSNEDGEVRMKWYGKECTNDEKLKIFELKQLWEDYFVEKDFKLEHIEKGLSKTSIVIRLIVNPDLF